MEIQIWNIEWSHGDFSKPCCRKDFSKPLCEASSLKIKIKIKLFVAREIQYFELGIFPFYSYVYYLTRGFIASNCPFNLLTSVSNLPTRAFSTLTCGFELVTRRFELSTRGFELVTRVLLFQIGGRKYCSNFHMIIVQ